MNNPGYKSQYMATLNAQIKLQTMNEAANRGSPARTQYAAAAVKGFVPAKISKPKK